MTSKCPLRLKNNVRQSEKANTARIRGVLPVQREHYRNYSNANIDWHALFKQMQHCTNKTLALYHKYPGIKYKTFMRRYKAWCEAGCSDAPDAVGTQDNRGGHNAAMTPEEESLCATFIITEYISKGKPLNREDIRHIILCWYSNLHPHVTRRNAIFSCGNSFLDRFMHRFRMYNSNGRIIKQPQITDTTNAYAQFYLALCHRAYEQYGSNMVFCMDETFWPLVPAQHSMVRIKASHWYPSVKTNNKEGLTLVVTIAADGCKLPLYFVAAGKTMRCTNKLRVQEPDLCYYSESGWMKENVMLHYLENVVYARTQGDNCALLVDSYKAHITDNVFEAAEKLNIELIVVPCQMTSTLSPLDVGVNGILKKIYGKEWRHKRLFEEDQEVSWASAASLAISAYHRVKPHSIMTAFANSVHFPPTKPMAELLRLESVTRSIYQVHKRAKRKKKPPPRSRSRSRKAVAPNANAFRQSVRVASLLSDPCANDAVIARCLVDNNDDFVLSRSEYYNIDNM